MNNKEEECVSLLFTESDVYPSRAYSDIRKYSINSVKGWDNSNINILSSFQTIKPVKISARSLTPISRTRYHIERKIKNNTSATYKENLRAKCSSVKNQSFNTRVPIFFKSPKETDYASRYYTISYEPTEESLKKSIKIQSILPNRLKSPSKRSNFFHKERREKLRKMMISESSIKGYIK